MATSETPNTAKDAVNVDTINDYLLFDETGSIKSGQEQASLPEQLTKENYRLVKHLADKVKAHTINKNRTKAFLEYNTRMSDQQVKPRWLPISPSPPIHLDRHLSPKNSTHRGMTP